MNIGERPRQLTVDIKPHHIKDGIARDSRKCIIAEAIRESHPDWTHIAVDVATIRATDPQRGIRSVWITPLALQRIILAVDQGDRKAIKPLKIKVAAAMATPSFKRTPAQKKKAHAAYLKRKKASTKKPRLVKGQAGGTVPIVITNKLPPIAAGAVRTFGLRGMRV